MCMCQCVGMSMNERVAVGENVTVCEWFAV